MTQLAFVDTETTGLDPHRHHIWEAAVILADHQDAKLVVTDHWFDFIELPLGALRNAEPTALRMTRFHERTADVDWYDPGMFAAQFARDTAGRHLVGAVPSFDERRLDDLLRAHGQCPAWHYHLIDVEALAAGYLARVAQDHADAPTGTTGAPPWRSDDLTAALGVTVPEDRRHTALGDAEWAMRTYAAVYGLSIVNDDNTPWKPS